MYPYGGPPPPLKAPNITGILLQAYIYALMVNDLLFHSEALTTTGMPSTLYTDFYWVSISNSTQSETFPDFPEGCADITVLYSTKLGRITLRVTCDYFKIRWRRLPSR